MGWGGVVWGVWSVRAVFGNKTTLKAMFVVGGVRQTKTDIDIYREL